jgi:hypothetical protein
MTTTLSTITNITIHHHHHRRRRHHHGADSGDGDNGCGSGDFDGNDAVILVRCSDGGDGAVPWCSGDSCDGCSCRDVVMMSPSPLQYNYN